MLTWRVEDTGRRVSFWSVTTVRRGWRSVKVLFVAGVVKSVGKRKFRQVRFTTRV
jgi:hypothetical protein